MLLAETLKNGMTNLEGGLFVFILGLFIVFFGIAIIVAVISIIGSIMSKATNKPKAEPKKEEAKVAENQGITDVERAAIVAVISAFYFAESKSTCDFCVKKIKRI